MKKKSLASIQKLFLHGLNETTEAPGFLNHSLMDTLQARDSKEGEETIERTRSAKEEKQDTIS